MALPSESRRWRGPALLLKMSHQLRGKDPEDAQRERWRKESRAGGPDVAVPAPERSQEAETRRPGCLAQFGLTLAYFSKLAWCCSYCLSSDENVPNLEDRGRHFAK